MAKFIIICGNPVDGFGYIGPFKSHGQCTSWAETNLRGTEWWASELEELEEDMVEEADKENVTEEDVPW